MWAVVLRVERRGDRHRRQPPGRPVPGVARDLDRRGRGDGSGPGAVCDGARIWSGPVSAVLLALVSGSLWGVFAVLTKGVVDQLDDGIWAAAAHP